MVTTTNTPPYLVHETENARLWLMPAPTFLGGLDKTIQRCAELGMQHLLSTVEPHEVSALGLEDLPAACLASEITLHKMPMADRQPPQLPETFSRVSSDLYRRLRKGESVGVHCKSGIGRSGMHVCALLGKLGFGLDEALTIIERERGLNAPNTPEQLDWLARNWAAISAK